MLLEVLDGMARSRCKKGAAPGLLVLASGNARCRVLWRRTLRDGSIGRRALILSWYLSAMPIVTYHTRKARLLIGRAAR